VSIGTYIECIESDFTRGSRWCRGAFWEPTIFGVLNMWMRTTNCLDHLMHWVRPSTRIEMSILRTDQILMFSKCDCELRITLKCVLDYVLPYDTAFGAKLDY